MSLEQFVRQMVLALAARDPGGVHRPVLVSELRGELLPYRRNRKALGLTNSEDYELQVLRLVAEEGGWVRTFPPDAAERAKREIAEPNPDLNLTETLGDATVQIGASALARLKESGVRSPESGASSRVE